MLKLDLTTHLINNPIKQSPKILGIAPKHLQPMASLEDLDIPVAEPWNFPPGDQFWSATGLEDGIAYAINLRRGRKQDLLYLAALDYRQMEVDYDPGFFENPLTLIYLDEAEDSLYGLTAAPLIRLRRRYSTYQQWKQETSLYFPDSNEPHYSTRKHVLISLATLLSSSPPAEPELIRTGSSGNQIHMLRVLLG